ncbi:hypothetical protein ACFLU6_02695 [Acidobacteriota bacterium]
MLTVFKTIPKYLTLALKERMEAKIAAALTGALIIELGILCGIAGVKSPGEARLLAFLILWALLLALALVLPALAKAAANNLGEEGDVRPSSPLPSHYTMVAASIMITFVPSIVCYAALILPDRQAVLSVLGITWNLPGWVDLLWLVSLPWFLTTLSLNLTSLVGVKKFAWGLVATQAFAVVFSLAVALSSPSWAQGPPFAGGLDPWLLVALPVIFVAAGMILLILEASRPSSREQRG